MTSTKIMDRTLHVLDSAHSKLVEFVPNLPSVSAPTDCGCVSTRPTCSMSTQDLVTLFVTQHGQSTTCRHKYPHDNVSLIAGVMKMSALQMTVCTTLLTTCRWTRHPAARLHLQGDQRHAMSGLDCGATAHDDEDVILVSMHAHSGSIQQGHMHNMCCGMQATAAQRFGSPTKERLAPPGIFVPGVPHPQFCENNRRDKHACWQVTFQLHRQAQRLLVHARGGWEWQHTRQQQQL